MPNINDYYGEVNAGKTTTALPTTLKRPKIASDTIIKVNSVIGWSNITPIWITIYPVPGNDGVIDESKRTEWKAEVTNDDTITLYEQRNSNNVVDPGYQVGAIVEQSVQASQKYDETQGLLTIAEPQGGLRRDAVFEALRGILSTNLIDADEKNFLITFLDPKAVAPVVANINTRDVTRHLVNISINGQVFKIPTTGDEENIPVIYERMKKYLKAGENINLSFNDEDHTITIIANEKEETEEVLADAYSYNYDIFRPGKGIDFDFDDINYTITVNKLSGFEGTYSPTFAYQQGDYVISNNKFFLAKTTHNAPNEHPATDHTNWQHVPLPRGIVIISTNTAFSGTQDYVIGDMVTFHFSGNDEWFLSLTTHAASTTTPDQDNTNWQFLNFASNWANQPVYLATKNDKFYFHKTNVDLRGSTPTNRPNDWYELQLPPYKGSFNAGINYDANDIVTAENQDITEYYIALNNYVPSNPDQDTTNWQEVGGGGGGGTVPTSITDLSDTPSAIVADQILVGDSDGNELVFTPLPIMPSGGGGGGTSTFIEDTDTPSSYAGQKGKLLGVNTDEDGLTFITPSVSGGSTPPTPTPIPQGAPFHLHIDSYTDTSLRLSWNNPKTTIIGYEIRYWDITDTANMLYITSSSVGVSADITGLTADTTYDLQVRAKLTTTSFSPWSLTITTRTSATPVTLSLAKPSGLMVYEVFVSGGGRLYARFRFNLVINSEAPYVYYSIFKNNTKVGDLNSFRTILFIDGRGSSGDYTFSFQTEARIGNRSSNLLATSPKSDDYTFNIQGAKVIAGHTDSSVYIQIENLYISYSERKFHLSWEPTIYPKYNIEAQFGADLVYKNGNLYNNNYSPLTVGIPSTNYVVTLPLAFKNETRSGTPLTPPMVINAYKDIYNYSNIKTSTQYEYVGGVYSCRDPLPPLKPVLYTATLDSTTIKLYFTPRDSRYMTNASISRGVTIGGGEISNYSIRYQLSTDTNWISLRNVGNHSGYTNTGYIEAQVDNLTSGNYNFQVQFHNSVGDSPWSDTSSSNTNKLELPPPGFPSWHIMRIGIEFTYIPSSDETDIHQYRALFSRTNRGAYLFANVLTNSSYTSVGKPLSTVASVTKMTLQARNARGTKVSKVVNSYLASGTTSRIFPRVNIEVDDKNQVVIIAIDNVSHSLTLSISYRRVFFSHDNPETSEVIKAGRTMNFGITNRALTGTNIRKGTLTSLKSDGFYEMWTQAASGTSNQYPGLKYLVDTSNNYHILNLTATEGGSGTIEVTWSIHRTIAPSYVKYELEYVQKGQTNWTKVTTSNQAYTLSNPVANTIYLFKVRTSFEGVSYAQSITVESGVHSYNIGLSQVGNNTIDVTWSAFPNYTGNYTLNYRKTGDTPWQTISTAASYDSFPAENLIVYQIKVQAQGYPDSPIKEYKALQITGLRAVASPNTLVITWDKLGTSQFSGNYDLQYSVGGQTTSVNNIINPKKTLSSLIGGTIYTIEVRAKENAYIGGWYQIDAMPGTSIGINSLKLAPRNTEIYAYWEVTSDYTGNYQLQYRVKGTGKWGSISSVSNNFDDITGLVNGTAYLVRVRRTGGKWSTILTGTPSEKAVYRFALTTVGTNIKATWNAVTGATSYAIEYRRYTGNTSWITAPGISSNAYTITSLHSNQAYRVRVMSSGVDAGGHIPPWSQEELITVDPAYNLQWTATTNSLILTWDAVIGAPSYEVQYKEFYAANWISVTQLTTNTYTIPSLQGKTSYQIRVKALRADWSQEHTGITN